MHTWLAIVLVFVATTSAVALDTGNAPPPKPATAYPANIPNPARQGGDTIADALVIPSVPYSDSGTTAGYTNDYDEVCPYSGSTAPDVVYCYTPLLTETVIIDLCGSEYDTKLYVYDADLNLVACNDDFYFNDACGLYVSALENVVLQGGATYTIVIDGYGPAFGPYVLDVATFVPCTLACPAGSFAEGEPPLVDDYVDAWNGGCNTSPGFPFQDLTGDAAGNLVLCGVSGWYLFHGNNYRDTDWFHVYGGDDGRLEVTADAEQPTYVWELTPHDCGSECPYHYMTAGRCHAASITIEGYPPDSLVWLWVAPTVFTAPSGYANEYDYVLWLSGLEPGPVATESTTWGTVKALYQ